jgi:hypothetical protein
MFLLRYFILLFFLFLTTILSAQKKQPVSFDGEELPRSIVKKVNRITKKDSTDTEKFNHICSWIVRKKRYDLKGFEKIRLEKYSLKKIVKSKRLLCREYTVLLKIMCLQAGIQSNIAEGYVKGAGHYPYEKYYYQTHEWNISRLDGRYQITDLTWASGYVVPKISLMGRIKKILNIPYIPRHWKFVRKLNPYYMDIPPAEQIVTHLPAHPMWQLLGNPYSLGYFENESKSALPIDTINQYPFANRIQHFSGRSIEEQLLIIADEGIAFNSKNNYIKGANYLTYAYRNWNSFAGKKEIPLAEKARRSPDVIKYTNIGETYLKRFLQDNDGVKQRCFDSLGRKNREINSFISKKATWSARKVNSLNSIIKNNDRINLIGELAISKKENEKLRRTNSESIYRVRRGKSKTINKDSLNLWFKHIAKNNIHLDSLADLYKKRQDSISVYNLQRGAGWDTILYYAQIKREIVSVSWQVDLATNNIYYLRKFHKTYDSIQFIQDKMEKSLRKAELYYRTTIRRYSDSIIRVAMKKVGKNKQLLVKIKKYNLNSADEEKLFEEQNIRLKYWYQLSIDNHRQDNLHRREYNSFYHEWNHYAKGENREFRRYAKVEKKCYMTSLKKERYRHGRYRYAGNVGLLNCILLTRKSKVFIDNYARVLRLKKK